LGGIFQRKLAQITRGPWTLATSADLRFRSVEGATANWPTRVMHWYVDQVLRLGTASVSARHRFLEVQGMLKDASAVLRPDMLIRVLFNQFRRSPMSVTRHEYLDRREDAHFPENYRDHSAEVPQDQNVFMETENIA
jgi:hypothetical protein